MTTDMGNLNRFVAQKNLERLQYYDIALTDPASDSNAIIGDKCKLAYSILKNWSDKNPDSIKKAIEATYISAADEINNVAKLWGMQFMQICDLPRQGYEEQPKWSGPYCGAFYTTEVQKSTPFIGLAFKGTSPFNLREILVDKNYQLVQAGDFLQGQSVSAGVYNGLFGDFSEKGKPSYKPYNHIFEQLGVIAKSLPRDEGTAIRAHVTEHSLGGSYSSMCSAQLLIDAPKFLPGFKMGDEYTFGAPRVGSNDWALINRSLATDGDGQIWRIANSDDLVPQVPPTDLFKIEGSFYHTDQGVTIFKDKDPQDIASEINGPPPPGRKFTSWKEFKRDVIDAGPHLKFTSRLL
ncbi:hypothetical protein LZL87_001980 [Fusarium oxysporum]|nr:hypothetical protein LZL87_001980 [Fusarium oxysporum]